MSIIFSIRNELTSTLVSLAFKATVKSITYVFVLHLRCCKYMPHNSSDVNVSFLSFKIYAINV